MTITTNGKSSSGSSYYSTNDALRSGKKPSEVPLTKDIDSALEKTKLAESTTVFRGLKAGAISAYPNMLKPGHIITDLGYQSTSVRKDIAKKFAGAGGYVFHIHAYKGAKALPLNGEKPPGTNALSLFPAEHEILLPRSTSIRVLKVDTKSHTIHAELLG